MQITAGMRYRILMANPIFNDMSMKKIKEQSIAHDTKMFDSMGSNGIFVAPIIPSRVAVSLLFKSFSSGTIFLRLIVGRSFIGNYGI
jgi:hypothetical protein